MIQTAFAFLNIFIMRIYSFLAGIFRININSSVFFLFAELPWILCSWRFFCWRLVDQLPFNVYIPLNNDLRIYSTHVFPIHCGRAKPELLITQDSRLMWDLHAQSCESHEKQINQGHTKRGNDNIALACNELGYRH